MKLLVFSALRLPFSPATNTLPSATVAVLPAHARGRSCNFANRELVFFYLVDPETGSRSTAAPIPYSCVTSSTMSYVSNYVVRTPNASAHHASFKGVRVWMNNDHCEILHACTLRTAMECIEDRLFGASLTKCRRFRLRYLFGEPCPRMGMLGMCTPEGSTVLPACLEGSFFERACALFSRFYCAKKGRESRFLRCLRMFVFRSPHCMPSSLACSVFLCPCCCESVVVPSNSMGDERQGIGLTKKNKLHGQDEIEYKTMSTTSSSFKTTVRPWAQAQAA